MFIYVSCFVLECFPVFPDERIEKQADVPLNYKYKQCHQSLGLLGKCIIGLVWHDLAIFGTQKLVTILG